MSSRDTRLRMAQERRMELSKSKRGGAMVDTDTQSFQVILGMTGQTYPIYYVGERGGVHTFNTMKPGASSAFPPGTRVAYVSK